ncbi:MAG: hypothetical protein ACXVFQ_16045 [Solirubrobacteraceae bacterium]
MSRALGDGMTKTMAEAKLRALISELVPPPPVVERLTVEEAARGSSLT